MRRLVWLVLLLAVYIAYGTYTSNFYLKMVKDRQQATSADPTNLKVALVYSDITSDGFLTGAEVALSETSDSDVKVELQTVVVDHHDSGLQKVSSQLRRDMSLSVMLCDVPARLESCLAVASETYGAGALLINARSPFVSSKGFRYVNLVEPGFRTFCHGVLHQLPQVCGKEPGETVHFAVFFDRAEVESDELVNSLVQSTERYNENYAVATRLRHTVEAGLLKETDLLSDVAEMYFLSSHLADDRPALNGLIRDFIDNHGTSTVGDALDAAKNLTNPLHSHFTHSIVSEGVDPAVLSKAIKEGDELDCLIIIGEVRNLKPVIRILRSLNVGKPIVVMDYEPAGWLEANYGTLARGLYLVTSVDTQVDNPKMNEFRRKFEEQARKNGRQVTQADEASVLAYESISMLKEVTASHTTTIPIEIMTLLQQYGANWPGLTTERVGFDQSGDGTGRDIFLVTLDNGNYRYLRKEEL